VPTRLALLALVLSAAPLLAGPRNRPSTPLDKALLELNHPEPLRRLRAMWTLEVLATEGGTADALIERLRDHAKLRMESVTCMLQVLGELGYDKAAPTLAELARTGKRPPVRIAAATGLARLQSVAGRDALRELVRERKIEAPIRRLALVALGMAHDAEVVALAPRLLESREPLDRRAGYRALGYSQAEGALELVVPGVNDRDPMVSSRAAWALAKLHGEAFVPRLAKLVDRMPRGGQRFMLLDALARLGVEGALQEVIARVQDPRDRQQYEAALTISETAARDAAPALRLVVEQSLARKRQPREVVAIALFALGKLRDQRALPILVRVLEEDALEHKRLAAEALGRLANPDAEAALLAASGARDLELRVQALAALSRLGAPTRSADLGARLADRDPVVRYFAVVALEASRDGGLRRLLTKVLEDPEPFVRVAAQQAHAVLGGEAPPVPDRRDPALLARYHALEREYVFGAETKGKARKASFDTALREVAYAATCGGTHPPVMTPELEAFLAARQFGARRELARLWREQLDASYVLRRARTQVEFARRERTRARGEH